MARKTSHYKVVCQFLYGQIKSQQPSCFVKMKFISYVFRLIYKKSMNLWQYLTYLR